MKEMIIGVLGGMGSYATLDFFRRYLEFFPAVKEWDRPRIIIDNNCTMPSRVVAALTGENKDVLIEQMSSSIRNLLSSGATHIVLGCNTSHIFLEDVYLKVPESKGKVINIIDTLAKDLLNRKCSQVSLIATEGTLETRIYQNIMSNYNICIDSPKRDSFIKMRELIEAVKQNKITGKTEEKFVALIEEAKYKNVILGCTEFPIIFERVKDVLRKKDINIFDPLESTLELLRHIYID